jgi:long-chain acyl-CoA synthetase
MLLRIPVVNSIIKKNYKLGLREVYIISGAPIAPSLVNWFETIGITVLEGYGMSEDTIISHFNSKEQTIVGTVGKAKPA